MNACQPSGILFAMPNEFKVDDILVKRVNDTKFVQHAEMHIPITEEERELAVKAFELLSKLRKRAAAAVEADPDDDDTELTLLDLKGVSTAGDGALAIVDFVQVNV